MLVYRGDTLNLFRIQISRKKMKLKEVLIAACLLSSSLSNYAQDLIPFRSGHLWGFCTPDKEVVIPPIYEYVTNFQDGLAAVSKGCFDCYDQYDGKWGFINEKGETVIPFQYYHAYPFYKGYTWVRLDGYMDFWAKINKKGELLDSTDSEPYLNKQVKKNILNSKKQNKKYTFNEDTVTQIGNIAIQKGYQSKTTNYWEDPEAVYFYPVSISYNKKDFSQSTKDTLQFTIASNRFSNELDAQSLTLPPTLVVLTQTDTGITVVKTFPLGADQKTENSIIYNKVLDSEGLIPYLRMITDADEIEEFVAGNNYIIMLSTSLFIPTNALKENVFFELYRKRIFLISTIEGTAFYHIYTSPYELMNEQRVNEILTEMIDDIKNAGDLFSFDERLTTSIIDMNNPYFGRTIAEVMTNVTKDEVLIFLNYMNAHPYIYMGETWPLSEIFATWVERGAPTK